MEGRMSGSGGFLKQNLEGGLWEMPMGTCGGACGRGLWEGPVGKCLLTLPTGHYIGLPQATI